MSRFAKRDMDEEKICKALEMSSSISDATEDIPVLGTVLSAGVAIVNFFVDNSLSSNCADKPFEEIKQILENRFDKVDKALDRNFQALKSISKMVTKTRLEVKEGFDRVLESIKSSRVEPLVLKLNNFIHYFNSEKERIKNLPQDEYLAKLKEEDNILIHLKASRTPSGDSMHTSLYEIINGGYAIPRDANDKIAHNALYALYYGTQTYISVMLFLLEQFLYLAQYHYEKRDLDEYNSYFDSAESTFHDFKYSLVDSTNSNALIPAVILTLHAVKVQHSKKSDDTGEVMSEKINYLKSIINELKTMELPLIEVTPEKFNGKISFKNDEIRTPIGVWKDGEEVQYAVQCENNGIYSKVGEWSDPFVINGKANPFLRIRFEAKNGRNFLFRKFKRGKPQLVAVLSNDEEVEFRDINRDAFNAASELNEEKALEEMEILLRHGADISAVFDQGRGAIHAAATADNYELAEKFLLSNPAVDVNAGDEDGYTPIHLASQAGHEKFVTLLIDRGADVNVKTTRDLLTPLHFAAKKGYAHVIEILLQNESTIINEKDKHGFTPLHSAIAGGLPAVNILLSSSTINVNAQSEKGFTPLHIASIKNDVETVDSLLRIAELNVNMGNESQMTSLHLASIFGYLDIVQRLVSQKDVNINAVSKNEWTALHFAVYLKRKGVAFALLNEQNTDVNVVTKEKLSPLHIALQSKQNDVAEKLLERGSDVQSRTIGGLTPLHIAAGNRNADMALILMNRGADIEVKADDERTPLHVAAASGSVEIVSELLKRGASVKAADQTWELPIHKAVLKGNVEVVKLLINHDFTLIDVTNRDKDSLLHYAVRSNRKEIIKYLIDQGFNVNAFNRFGRTPVHVATEEDNLTLIKYLYERGASLDASDEYGYKPVYLAAQKGYLDIIKYFINSEVIRLDTRDVQRSKTKYYDDAFTVLHWTLSDAVENNRFEIIKYLIGDKNVEEEDNAEVFCDLLLKASENGYEYLVKYFIEKKHVYVDCTDKLNYYPLALAIEKGYADIVRYLVEKGAFLSNKSLGDDTFPLRSAVMQGNLDIVKYLVRKGAILDLPNSTDDTLLHDAATYNHLDIAKYLVEELNLDVDAKNTLDFTPLHKAAMVGAEEVVMYLIDKGADVEARNKDGKTPLDLIPKELRSKIEHYVYTRNRRYTKPFIVASKTKNIDRELKEVSRRRSTDDLTTFDGFIDVDRLHHRRYFLSLVNDPSRSLETKVFDDRDLNGSLMFLDFLIRNLTGRKMYSSAFHHQSAEEARAEALRITAKFEDLLSSYTDLPVDEQIDLFDVYSSILRALVDGKRSTISSKLCSYAKTLNLLYPEEEKRFFEGFKKNDPADRDGNLDNAYYKDDDYFRNLIFSTCMNEPQRIE